MKIKKKHNRRGYGEKKVIVISNKVGNKERLGQKKSGWGSKDVDRVQQRPSASKKEKKKGSCTDGFKRDIICQWQKERGHSGSARYIVLGG